MSKLLILTLFLAINTFGSTTPKKAPPEPVNAFRTATVRLSTTYTKSYPSSEVLLRVLPKTLKDGKKLIGAKCKKYSLDCAIFPDNQQANLLNISVHGSSSNIKKLLTWTKANSSKYSETQHKKK